MSPWLAVLTGVAVLLALYGAFLCALLLAGRDADARALVRFVPDCAVLARRLLQDRRVRRSRKLLLAGLLAYLAMPFDLVPDFVPVAGVLDDALVVALALRSVLRAAGPAALLEHWPGPEPSLRVVQRLAFPGTVAARR
ncbi:MAG TPA: YkvA family protein [Solirubrobacteraceae bacterium]|nr:YkvA family protein [Solirubrobacteraceae bacterium]